MKQLVYRAVVITALAAFVMAAAGCDQAPPDNKVAGVVELPFEPAPEEPPKYAILIANAEDLAKIGKDGAFPLDGVYKLTANITVGDWAPIGGDNDFTGAFYGMDNTITITGGSGGVFASLDKATVYNLKVNVTATADGGSIGGITGYAKNSLIKGCEAAVVFTLNKGVHNSSAGGIVGYMWYNVEVRACTASGSITLTSETAGQMVYAGGIAGYSGSGLQGQASVKPTSVTRSSWSGTVSASGGYPYAGGVVGYNYTGGKITRCSSAGTVTATGGNLPYAGGVAGYNSGGDIDKPTTNTEAVIENCYSTAAVAAVSTSKAALAGGVAGSNACRARISKCYATGAVTATVVGNSATEFTAWGVMTAASAGGIAGAQYYKGPLRIEYCAALNASITGTDNASGAVWNIYRIAGAGVSGSDTGVFTGNIAYSGMTITNHTGAVENNASGKDGANCGATPGQSEYTGMGWDFSGSGIWTMSEGYPVLKK